MIHGVSKPVDFWVIVSTGRGTVSTGKEKKHTSCVSVHNRIVCILYRCRVTNALVAAVFHSSARFILWWRYLDLSFRTRRIRWRCTCNLRLVWVVHMMYGWGTGSSGKTESPVSKPHGLIIWGLERSPLVSQKARKLLDEIIARRSTFSKMSTQYTF